MLLSDSTLLASHWHSPASTQRSSAPLLSWSSDRHSWQEDPAEARPTAAALAKPASLAAFAPPPGQPGHKAVRTDIVAATHNGGEQFLSKKHNTEVGCNVVAWLQHAERDMVCKARQVSATLAEH